MAVTASSVRTSWSIPTTIDDTLLTALITQATARYRSATGEAGLTAYAAHLAFIRLQSLGGAGGRAITSASHNAASKTLEAAAFFTPRSPTEAWFLKTAPGADYWAMTKDYPLSYIVTPNQ